MHPFKIRMLTADFKVIEFIINLSITKTRGKIKHNTIKTFYN